MDQNDFFKSSRLCDNEWFCDLGDDGYWMVGDHRKPVDRREDFRESAHLAVDISPGGVHGMVEDISVGGVFVYTENVLDKGRLVRLTLMTDGGAVKAYGLVKWVAPARHDGGQLCKPGMGIQFVYVSVKMREVLGSVNLSPIPDAV